MSRVIKKIPFIIGVTGHRDIASDRDILKKKVEEIINKQIENNPYTPIVVLSPLAEGGDRIVAEVAIELRDAGKDVSLYVPLPLSEEYYKEDFGDSEVFSEYERLKSESDEVFTLDPYLSWSGAEESKLSIYCNGGGQPIYSSERNVQYAQVGAYIARHSNLLIALYDGKNPEKVGGTSEIVKFFLGKDMVWGEDSDGSKISPPSEFVNKNLAIGGEVGKLQIIPVNRSKDGDHIYGDNKIITKYASTGIAGDDQSESGKERSGKEGWSKDKKKEYDSIVNTMEDYNKSLDEVIVGDKIDIAKSEEYFYEDDGNDLIVAAKEVFAVHDSAALFWQKKNINVNMSMLTLLFIVFFSYQLSQVFVDVRYLAYGQISVTVSIVSGLVFIAIWLWSKHTSIKERFLRARTLAELARIYASARYSGSELSLSTLFKYISYDYIEILEIFLNWMSVRIDSVMKSKPADDISMKSVKENWIDNQIGYFTGKSCQDKEKKNRRCSRWSTIFIVVSVILLAIFTLMKWKWLTVSDIIMAWVGISASLAVAAAAIVSRIRSIYTYDTDVFDNNIKLRNYRRAKNHLEHLSSVDVDLSKRQEIISDLAQRSILYELRWFMMHSKERVIDTGSLLHKLKTKVRRTV